MCKLNIVLTSKHYRKIMKNETSLYSLSTNYMYTGYRPLFVKAIKNETSFLKFY